MKPQRARSSVGGQGRVLLPGSYTTRRRLSLYLTVPAASRALTNPLPSPSEILLFSKDGACGRLRRFSPDKAEVSL